MAMNESLKALCSGHIFSLYSPAAHLPGGFSKSEVFLFYRPGPNNAVGKIYVAGASGDLAQLTAIATTMTEDQLVAARLPTVDAARLSAVTLDKATAELKAAATVSADLCFQFGTPEMSLSLSADSKQTRDHWTQGLVLLMTEAQKSAAAQPPLSPTSAAAAAAAAAAPRRFSFDVKDPSLAEQLPLVSAETMNRLANNDVQLLSIPALDFVSMMLVGRNFGFYADMAGKATRFPVFLFYKFEQGTPGYLYWCNPGTRTESPQTCLPLAKIDRLYVGKQVAVFTPEAKEDCCFTLLTPEAMVNLEAGSPSQASAWLYAIDAALRGYSQRRFHHTEADPKAQRYYVDGVNAPNRFLQMGPVVTETLGQAEVQAHANDQPQAVDQKAVAQEIRAETTAAALALAQAPGSAAATNSTAAPATQEPAPAAAAQGQGSSAIELQPIESVQRSFGGTGPSAETYAIVQQLKAGNSFVLHSVGAAPDAVVMHYTPDGTKAGSLTYESLAHHGSPKKIPLQNISDMSVGRNEPEFARAGPRTEPLACLTITYRVSADASARLCVEGKSKDVVDFWVHGIHAVIQHALSKGSIPTAPGAAGAAGAAEPATPSLRVGPSINVADVKVDFGVAGAEEAPSSPRARLPVGSECDLNLPTDVLVAMIARGRAFTKWTAGAAASEPITLTYKKDETKTGSFYFSGAAAAAADADGKAPRFPLHNITEIVVGKQTADFAAAAGSPDETCVSFVTAEKGSLSVEAESKEVVSAWLSAITSILKSAGKEVVLNEADAEQQPVPLDPNTDAKLSTTAAAAAFAQRRFTVTLSADNLLATAPASLTEADHVALLSHGARFTKYERDGEPIWLTFVRDGTRSGSLYWCGLGDDPRKHRSLERALPVHTIADFYFGKQTIQFTSFAASREPEELCVSIVTRDGRSLNLAAASAEQLSSFLLALQTVLAEAGKRITTGDDKQFRTQHARRFTVTTAKPSIADRAAGAGAGAASAVPAGRSRKASVLSLPAEDVGAVKELTAAELAELVSNGVKFRLFDATANAVKDGVLLFHAKDDDSKIGSLYWSEDGTKPAAAAAAALPSTQRGALDSLKDVVLGVGAYPALAAAGFDEKRTASLVFAGVTIQVEAETAEALSNFLLGVHNALTSAGSTVVTEDVGRVRKFSVVPSAAAATAAVADEKAPAAAAAAAAAANPEAVKVAEAGASFTAFTVRGGAVKHQKVRVSYVAGADGGFGRVFWALPQDGDAQTETFSVGVADITEFVTGKAGSKALVEGAAPFGDDVCFTLQTNTKSLAVAAESADAVAQWEAAITAAIAGAAVKAEQTARAIDDATTKAESLSLFGGAPSSPAAKDALQLIHKGHDFQAYKLKGGRLQIISLFLFYEPTNANSPVDPHTGVSFGELYWAAPGKRAPKPKHHIRLSTVTDLFIGRHSDMLVFRDAPADVTDDRVFTIIGTDQTLSVEAPSAAVAQAWIAALSYILERHGRDRLVQDEDGKTLAPNAVPARRRVSFLPYEVSAPAPVPNVSAHEVGVLFAAGRSDEVMSQQTAEDIVTVMRYGRKFTAFLENHARTLLLFFAPSPVEHREGPGRLYWSHPSHRAESPLNSLLLTAIQDYSLGKSAKAFHIAEGKGADERRCFSLTTKYGVFCFEASSPAMRDTWIAGINFLLVSSGNKKLQIVTPPAPAPAAAADAKDAKDAAVAVAAAPDPSQTRYCFVDDVNLEALSSSTFDLARQMVRDPKVLSAHTDAALRLMREGNYFFAFFFNKERGLLRHKIFVFFKPSIDPTDGTAGLGTLFWNERENYDENPVRRLCVNDITDIYVGKQSSPFRHEKAADVPDNTCFSLVSQTKTLNLQAPSATVLNVWLLGLNALINGARKDVSLRENDRNAQAAQAAQAAAAATAQAGSWLSAPKPEGVLARVQHMAQTYKGEQKEAALVFVKGGSNFVKFTPNSATEPAKQVVSLFYRPSPASAALADGALYWCAVNQRDVDPARSVPLSALREVVLLKQTAGFRIPEAADAPENRCFTLKTHSGEALYFCAATTDELNVWLYGLVFLLTANDKVLRVVESESAAAAQQPVLPTQQAVDQAKYAAAFDLMHRGAKFFAYAKGAKAGEVVKRQVFVCVEDDKQNPRKAGALVWRSAGAVVSRLEIDEIEHIFLGKRVQPLVSLKQLDGDRCFSVVTPTLALNLEADSKKQVVAWVYGLYCALRASGRIVNGLEPALAPQPLTNGQVTAQGLDPARPLLQELEADSTVEHTTRTLAGAAAARTAASENAVRSLIKGRVFTAYSATGVPRKETVFVWYEPSIQLNGAGALKWVAGDAPAKADGARDSARDSARDGARLLPLDKVSDIVLGKQNAAFRTVDASDADPERCVSILSDDLRVALHLEARTAEAAKTLLVALNTAMAVAGREIVLLGNAGSSASAVDGRRYAVMTAAAATGRGATAGAGAVNRSVLTAPLLADTVSLLSRGAEFVAHSAHAPHTNGVFVFYKADTYSRGGALYWCEVGKRAESAERRLPVDAITHFSIGKAAPAFQTGAAAAVADDLCLSIYGANRALHVQAANADVVQCWFVALNGLLCSLGKNVNDDGEQGRWVVVGAPVAADTAATALLADDDESAYGPELDGTTLYTLSDVIVWEGFLKARGAAAGAVAAPLYFRLTPGALSYFGAANDTQSLGSIPLGAVLRVKTVAAQVSLLVSCKRDDRIVRLTAQSAGAANALALALKELAKNQHSFVRLDLAELNSGALLFADAATKADAEAAAADADEKWPAAAEGDATLQLTIGNASLSRAVAPNSVLSVVVNAAGVVVEGKATVTVDEDGLVPRQRIAFNTNVAARVALYDSATGKPRNLLVDVQVLSGADVVGHWTNGTSDDAADWSALPHPQVVSSFWQSLDGGAAYRNEGTLTGADGQTVGTIELTATLKTSGAAGAAGAAAAAADEKYSAAAVLADAKSDDIVLALTPEETMQMLAERPAGSLSAEELADAKRVMTAGQTFTRYTADALTGRVSKEEVNLFFSASSGALGSLFWSPAGTRVQSFKRRLPLAALSSVTLGKAGAALRAAAHDRSVTLTCSKFALALEAKTTHHLTAFLAAIHAIKTASGKRAVAQL